MKYCFTVSTAILICAASFSQSAPGWSRGQQVLKINYEGCLTRASQALATLGYRIDYNQGSFRVGIKNVHTAVVNCLPAQSGTYAIIMVASNGDGGGLERQCLQALMENPGASAACGTGNYSTGIAGTWIWAYAPPGQELQVHNTVKFNADGTFTSNQGSGKWSQSGNHITAYWPSSTDDLILSDDGKTLTGKNKDGWNIRGTKQ